MTLISNIKDLIRMIIGEVPTRKLIKRGLKVGSNLNRQQGCFIDPTHCWLIEIGNNVTMSIRVVIMAHDASTKKILGYTKIGKIKIEDNVFIGANSIILPNVTIGKNSIIGANSVISKNVPPNCVVAGNPARVIYSLDEFKVKNQSKMHNKNIFNSSYMFTKGLTDEKKQEMINTLNYGIGYIE